MNNRRRILLSAAVAGVVVVSATAMAFGSEILPGDKPAVKTELAWQRQAADQQQTEASSAPGVASSAAPGGTTSTPARTTTLESASASIAYLRQQYGISEAEAVRRIELQQASTEIAGTIARKFPDEYAGMWLDQAAGGVLKVGMTAPDKLGQAVAGLADAPHIKAVPAKRSLRQLTEAAQQLSAELGAAATGAVAVDVPSNSIVVATGDAVRADDPRLAALLASKGARAEPSARTKTVEKSCDPLHCERAPMRGGIRLDVPRDDGTVGGCTTGFNLRSATTGARYVLIAAHCVRGGRHTRVDDTFHEYLGARRPVNLEDTVTPGLVEYDPANARDYAILPYAAGAEGFWWTLPPRVIGPLLSTVNYRCPGGCAGSHDVRITGSVPFASVQVGWVVCATGAGYTPAAGETYVDSGAGRGYVPGTHCGEITGKDSRIIVRMCARPGDSGGPLFTEADGKALGILNTGDSRSGACVPGDTERNWYMPVSTILERANAANGGALALELMTVPPLKDPVRRAVQP